MLPIILMILFYSICLSAYDINSFLLAGMWKLTYSEAYGSRPDMQRVEPSIQVERNNSYFSVREMLN